MAELRYSRQREAIMSFLMSRKDHPTADMVYQNVREEFPNISLGTVYRNLTLLSDLGEIQRLHLNDGTDHFDADTSEHYHFVCSCCKKVIDLEVKNLDIIKGLAQESFNGTIDGHVTYFYGTCNICSETVNNN